MRIAALMLGLVLAAVSLGWWLWTARPFEQAEVRDATPAEVLAARVALLEDEIRTQTARIDSLERTLAALSGTAEVGEPGAEMPLSTFGGFDELMLLSARRNINEGLTSVGIATLTETFGIPAPALSDQCTEPTSPRLLAALETREVAGLRVRMVRPALDSLERVLTRVQADYPDLFAQLRTYGAFCVRLIRGSTDSISRHAFGIAIDLSIGGTLDAMGDGKTQFGLIILSEYFYEEGWIWGAAFGREDSMHFEVSAELLGRWLDEGLL